MRIIILGGGTAGWMTAAALSRFASSAAQISLVESDAIGTVGVGEATIPHIRVFNDMLGIAEHDFIRATQATFKVGIKFEGWGASDSTYYHPFGDHGFSIKNVAFQHYWLAARASQTVAKFDDFSLANTMAIEERFTYPSANPDKVESTFSYAYHLDASAYAKMLRAYSEERGVKRIEGEVSAVKRDSDSGYIQSLLLKNGQEIAGDLFVDCSGFHARLISKELQVPYVSWKHWLPCDRAIAVPSKLRADPVPYTRSTAKAAGWCWQIPLQHRQGNGHVFCSDYLDEQTALDTLVAHISSELLAEPRHIRFEAGMRAASWEKNCVAIGLSSGFLEPLESTSIYLIQVGIYKLLELLPVTEDYSLEAREFNRVVKDEYEKVRDFIILHYWLNHRSERFWQDCAAMSLPDSLAHKIEVFKNSGEVVEYEQGLFMSPSWLSLYLGQGLYPDTMDSRIARLTTSDVQELLDNIPLYLRNLARSMPTHRQALLGQKKDVGEHSSSRLSLYGVRR
jgi:tryptophan halogenase